MDFNEFKLWLQGVEDMQPEDWTPNATQWKRIRERLNNVDHTVVDDLEEAVQDLDARVKVLEATKVTPYPNYGGPIPRGIPNQPPAAVAYNQGETGSSVPQGPVVTNMRPPNPTGDADYREGGAFA